jgi:hypothetical protein
MRLGSVGCAIDAIKALAPLILLLCLTGCAATTEYVSTPEVAASPTPAAALPTSPASAETPTRELTVSERATLADAFSASLSNPEDVKFRWTRIPIVSGEGRRSLDYCAQLDTRNGKGTYRGMQPFLASIIIENGVVTGGAIAATSSDGIERDPARVPTLCRQKGLDPFA